MAKRKLRQPWIYRAELNRPVGDSTNKVVRWFERRGYEVERIPHLTSLTIRLPDNGDFESFKSHIAEVLQPRRGSALVHSTSGRSWICSNRGNRPGRFVRLGS